MFRSCPASAQYAGIHHEWAHLRLPSDWRAVRHHKSPWREFVRKGDSIKNWRELIDAQQLPRTPWTAQSPEAFLDSLKARREKECPGITKWQVIQQDEYSIVYEWRQDKSCAGARRPTDAVEQRGIARIVYGRYKIFVLRYAARGRGSLVPGIRAKWVKWLSGDAFTIDAKIDEAVPFSSAQVIPALEAAMGAFDCKVKKATSGVIDCKRPMKQPMWVWKPPADAGGEKVTAVLEPEGNETRVRITTGFGFSGNLVKQNWSYPIFCRMMSLLKSRRPRT